MPYGVAILIAVLGAVFSGLYWEPFLSRRAPEGESQTAAIVEHVPLRTDEEAFENPVPANWEGRIIGVLEGGRAYAIERENGQRFYGYVTTQPAVAPQGPVRIRGLWLGTTCAYRQTVFAGVCVPEVEIRHVESLE